tara:strand:+ start:181 stop:525 length:345 start_codon:yes stop_codon:yes gene_type:complete
MKVYREVTSSIIIIALMLSALATYLCRATGIMLANSIDVESKFFIWIKYVSFGVISAVISKIVFFPVGILEDSQVDARIISTVILVVSYYSIKNNILLSLSMSILTFYFFHAYL